jgi:hypothetical protein
MRPEVVDSAVAKERNTGSASVPRVATLAGTYDAGSESLIPLLPVAAITLPPVIQSPS